jgi:hypothetical protein
LLDAPGHAGNRGSETASFARQLLALQPEEYRYETARMQMIAAKGLRHPIPVEDLALQEPGENPATLGPSSEKDSPPASTDADAEKTS